MKKKAKTAILSFVPVIHKGYLDFFRSQPGDILIFNQDLIDEYVHLTRDLRTVPPREMVKALKTLLPRRAVKCISSRKLKSIKYERVIMPDDEVCHDISEKKLAGRNIEFIPVFLRWNKVITFKEFEISPGRKISTDEFHREILEKASKEASKSSDWWRQIACLIVKDGKIIFSEHNHHLPTDFHLSVNGDPRSNFDAGQHQDIYTSIHSEAAAVAAAAREGLSLQGASAYVTTFPCPNCARLLGKAGVKAVYYSKGYSLLDAEKILDHFGVEVILVQ